MLTFKENIEIKKRGYTELPDISSLWFVYLARRSLTLFIDSLMLEFITLA